MESYFFIGVAGVGMSAIAQYLVGKGVSISGSDRQFGAAEKPLVMTQLEECGVKCFPQDGSGVVAGLSAVVVSTAIEDTNPDLKEPETGLARLAVSDTGIGISDADKPNLFKRFWRSDASRSLPGNGLGLAVVKAIVTSYGGSVTCTSRPGVGTTFVVKL